MIRKVKIFISSPNDLKDEREICKRIINELNATLPKEHDVWLDPFFWEEETRVIGMGTPQGLIDSPAEYDLFIGMFWKRYGTPTGDIDPETGEKYMSGTEQEFKEAYQAWKKSNGKKPVIKFLRKLGGEEISEDNEEYARYKRVEAFFSNFEVTGRNPGLYLSFSEQDTTVEDSKGYTRFESIIRQCILDYIKGTQASTYLGHHYADAGVTGLFLPGDNNLRNESKREAIRNATKIRLIAHAGNSYLNSSAGRFYADVKACLDMGGEAEIILANPYSEMGYYITAGNIDERDHHVDSLVDCLRKVNSAEMIEKIDDSDWVNDKLKAAVRGFNRLERSYHDHIRLKMCSYEMSSTILLTDKVAFLEPYLHCVGAERGMNAFEIRVEQKVGCDNAFDALLEYFEFLWTISESYTQYKENESTYKKELRKKMRRLDDLLKLQLTEV